MDISIGLTIRELSPMEVQLCSQGETNEDSLSEKGADLSQDVPRTPISSQVVPMNDLGLSSQCSSSCATPSKDTSISTPKSRKRNGYRATKDRMRDAIKKRRSDDTEFRDNENETRLASVKKDREDPETRAKHNNDESKRMTNKLKDPAERAKHNASVADKLKDPAERAKHNAFVADKLKDPAERAKHNAFVADKLKDPAERAKHNAFVADKLKDPAERAKHNAFVADKLKDPAERAKHNATISNKLSDPAERAKYNERQLKLVTAKRVDSKEKMKHNLAELDRYRTMQGALKSVILKYLSEIAEGPTFVCSCCGCLHFRKTVNCHS